MYSYCNSVCCPGDGTPGSCVIAVFGQLFKTELLTFSKNEKEKSPSGFLFSFLFSGSDY